MTLDHSEPRSREGNYINLSPTVSTEKVMDLTLIIWTGFVLRSMGKRRTFFIILTVCFSVALWGCLSCRGKQSKIWRTISGSSTFWSLWWRSRSPAPSLLLILLRPQRKQSRSLFYVLVAWCLLTKSDSEIVSQMRSSRSARCYGQRRRVYLLRNTVNEYRAGSPSSFSQTTRNLTLRTSTAEELLVKGFLSQQRVREGVGCPRGPNALSEIKCSIPQDYFLSRQAGPW